MFAANKTGVTSTPAVTTDPYFNYTTLLLNDTGTNGAQNNTFVDSSTNNFSITRNGNTTQGSFNPYEPTGYWGGYFDGTGDYLNLTSTSALQLSNSTAFTIECWIYADASVIKSLGGFILRAYNFSSPYQGYGLGFGADGTNSQIQFWDGTAWISFGTVSANTWTHIAISYEGSGSTRRFFINGVQQGSAGTVPSTINWTGTTFNIGTRNADFYYMGYISNFRIVKGTAVYTSAFTPPTTPLTAITNTSLLCLQDNRFKDNSSNNFTLTRSGDVAVTGFNPFAPTASYTTSAYGGSAYFDGSGDYLEIPYNSAFDFGTGDFTIETYFYPTSVTGVQELCTKQPNGIAALALQLRLNNTALEFVSRSSNLTGTITLSGGTVIRNAWNHAAIVKNSGTLTLYLNGISVATASSSNNLSGSYSFYVSVLVDGRLQGYFNGYISNMRVVKGTAVYTANFTPPTAPVTAISGTSLLLNATNAGIYDATAINDMETVGNAQVSTTQTKWGPGSVYFDGTGDYLAFPSRHELMLGTGPYTVECWVYNSELVNSNTLFTWWVSGTNRRNVHIGSTNINYASQSTLFIAAAHGMVINQWYHIALTYDGTTTRIFIDGVVKGTYTGTQMLTTPAPFYIGAGASTLTSDYFYGYIEDLRVTKGVARYTSAFTPPTAAFPTR